MQMFIQKDCNSGGSEPLAAGYFAGWHGPVKESDYQIGSNLLEAPVQKHVQNIYTLPAKKNSTDNDWVKYAIMNFGGVHQTSGCCPGNPYDAYPTFYMPEVSTAHAVTLVGWDDNFSRDKFKIKIQDPDKDGVIEITPPGDGAFIAKNNSGPSYGANGYFFISYFDGAIKTQPPWAYTAESLENYNRIYQYDRTSSGTPAQAFRAGNVFTAESNDDLAAVGFYGMDTENQNDLKYIIEIFLDPTNGPTSDKGPVATVKTVLPMGGYYTVKLPKKIPLKTGQKFSVVLSSPITYNLPWVNLDQNAPTKPGQGFLMNTWNGNWDDVTQIFPGRNLCIKAYTVPAQLPILVTAVRRYGLDLYRLAWDVTNTSSSTQVVKTSAFLYKQGLSGLQRMAEEVTGEYHASSSGMRKMNSGILQLLPGEEVTVISRPGINDLVEKVASNAYTLQHGTFKLIDTWRYHDLFKTYIQITATDPTKWQNVSAPVSKITVTFDSEIKMGPNFWGVTLISPGETRFCFNSIAGNVLVIHATAPIEPAFGTTTWKVNIPKDSVQDKFGNKLEKDYTFEFSL